MKLYIKIIISLAAILIIIPSLYYASMYFLICVYPGFEARKTYRSLRTTLSSNHSFEVVNCVVSSGGDWDPFLVETTLRMKNSYYIDLTAMGVSTSDFEYNDFVVSRIYSLDRKKTNDLTNFNRYVRGQFVIEELHNYNTLFSKSFFSVPDFFSNIDDLVKKEILPKDLQIRGTNFSGGLYTL